MPNVSNLVQTTDYNIKISEIEKEITDHVNDKYITTPEFNNFNNRKFCLKTNTRNLAS